MFIGSYWGDLFLKALIWLLVTLFLAFDVSADALPLFEDAPSFRNNQTSIRRGIKSSRAVNINSKAELSNFSVRLNSNGESLLAVTTSEDFSGNARSNRNRATSKKGVLFNSRGVAGDFVITSNKDSLHGLFRGPKGEHFVLRKSGDSFLFEEANHDEMPDCGHDITEPNHHGHSHGRLDTSSLSPRSTEYTVLDVLVMYTPEARAEAGGTAAIEALAAHAITLANESYDNSGLSTLRLNLVHTQETIDAESGNFATDLSRLASDGDGFFDEAHTLRDTHKADMVAMLVAPGAYCGIGYSPSSIAGLESGLYAFSLTATNCVNYYSFQHEIGHNLGLQHDRDYAPSTVAYAGSYGWRWTGNDSTLYRSVMAYAPGIRVPYFSNANINHKGAATGVNGTANNAQTLFTVATYAQNYRHNPDPYTGGGEGGGGEGEENTTVTTLDLTTQSDRRKKRSARAARYNLLAEPKNSDGDILEDVTVDLYRYRKSGNHTLLKSGISNESGTSFRVRVKLGKRMRIFAHESDSDVSSGMIRLRSN